MGFPCPHAPLCILNMFLEMALGDTVQAVSSAGIPDETGVEEGKMMLRSAQKVTPGGTA